jgi:hypothetical protein
MARNPARPKDMRVPRARQFRRAMTNAERRLWWKLRELKFSSGHGLFTSWIRPYRMVEQTLLCVLGMVKLCAKSISIGL